MGLSLFSVELLAKINICLSAFKDEPATHFSNYYGSDSAPLWCGIPSVARGVLK
jgi:hypothetical protein